MVGVVGISDTFGGAKFPDISLVAPARRLPIKAMELNVNGLVSGVRALLAGAALIAGNAAPVLTIYVDDTSAGAERGRKLMIVIVVWR